MYVFQAIQSDLFIPYVVGGHLTFRKGHLTIPKRPHKFARFIVCSHLCACCLGFSCWHNPNKKKSGNLKRRFQRFSYLFVRVRQGIGKAFDNETGAFVKLPKADLEGKLVKFSMSKHKIPLPICSMYGIFTYIWLKSMVNVSKYSIHGSYGLPASSK